MQAPIITLDEDTPEDKLKGEPETSCMRPWSNRKGSGLSATRRSRWPCPSTRTQLSRARDSIVFVDEGVAYIKSTEFAPTVRGTDNYYVLITREALYALPYSVDEVYCIKTSGKYHHLERVYRLDEKHSYGADPPAHGGPLQGQAGQKPPKTL